ncbi:YbjN domain-containing protein [bacterium]|nr:YbjN domain-containing protein [bacterium]
MSKNFEKIIEFAEKLSLDIVNQDVSGELIVVNNEDKGIYNMIIDCEGHVLIFEQLIYDLKAKTTEHLTRLLQMNRNLLHGAFVINEEGDKVIFRDTLQIENLDFNEFEGTINALSLGLAEYSGELLSLNK